MICLYEEIKWIIILIRINPVKRVLPYVLTRSRVVNTYSMLRISRTTS